jgi:hypothetical protein
MTAKNQKVSSLAVRQMTLDSKTIHRIKKHETYTRIENDTLRDPLLSFKATGLLAFMLSRPDDWHFFVEELSKAKTDGEFSVRSAMKELVERGYVRREQVREDGKIVAILVHVYERPKAEAKRKRA